MVSYFPCIHCGYLNNEKAVVCIECGKKIGEEKRIIAVKRKRSKINFLTS
ncbi:MAG: hypothetical protein N3E48_03545 [Candidatus Bathyarchaeota archaeon]|nr:hypothetical protein [Candidatus Bathyarchaeota archaeon]